ncbi:hypothetical protein ACFYM2_23105 [Streptomyces sp. NPDC006711]|uniref:hypothetical protein n=1 Tax=Streptomyces sp. NPDC006711 TaxID=3364762 RepID=UPI0036A9BE9C
MHSLIRTAGFLRTAGFAAAGLSVALVVTGCGSGENKTAPATKSPAGSSAPSAAVPDGGGSTAKGGDLQGSWTATSGGKTVTMVVADKGVGLLTPHVCSGTVDESAGMTMLVLKCADGDTERTRGMATLQGDILQVKWQGGGTDSFTRGKTGALPSGLPSKLPTP